MVSRFAFGMVVALSACHLAAGLDELELVADEATGGGGGTTTTSTGGSGGVGGGDGCGGHDALCGGTCVNIVEDPANCGACGTVCDAAWVCDSGTCAPFCTPPLTACDGRCVHLDDDPEHCGSCGMACNAGQVCEQGSCASACSPGTTQCDDGCTSPTSPHHCGGCFEACDDGDPCTFDRCEQDGCNHYAVPGCGPMPPDICSDGTLCTVDSMVNGECQNRLFPQVGIEQMCARLFGYDPNVGCVYCNPFGEFCNFAADGMPCTDADEAPGAIDCGTCTFNQCDYGLLTMCPE